VRRAALADPGMRRGGDHPSLAERGLSTYVVGEREMRIPPTGTCGGSRPASGEVGEARVLNREGAVGRTLSEPAEPGAVCVGWWTVDLRHPVVITPACRSGQSSAPCGWTILDGWSSDA